MRVETWSKLLVLSVGGTFGVNSRYWLGVWMNRWASPQFPWATVVINVSGSFAIGFLTVALARWLSHPNIRLLLITGFLGGYTTFSTFEYDTLVLWERGESRLMAANVLGSVVAGLAAVWLGTVLARALSDRVGAPVSAPAARTGWDRFNHPVPVATDEAARIGATSDFPGGPSFTRSPEDGNSDDDPS
jgi:CrcB protein